MWRLINTCLEAGMDVDETFSVALTAKCNKYARDNRPISYLWREVKKASKGQQKLTGLLGEVGVLKMPELVEGRASEGFVEQYVSWASDATDAVSQFHELCGFITLSSLLSGTIRLDVSYGEVVPNLWGLVLGDSTLTRKTTAMRMAIELITGIDEDAVLATDGSVEGLLTGLQLRPSMPSIFFRDEVTGFFESIQKRDYLSGMAEALTHLYDVPPLFKRLLRKETISVQNPILIFFGGGIKDKVYSLLSEEYVLSGFLPRFLVVSADADLTKLKPTGPSYLTGSVERKALSDRLAEMYEQYNPPRYMRIAGQDMAVDAKIKAHLTDDAWLAYQKIEGRMTSTAADSHISNLALPTFERLSRSLLKMSVLLGASRQEPVNDEISIGTEDVQNAAWYVQRWGNHSIELMYNAGKPSTMKVLDRIRGVITEKPGMSRGEVMRLFHLTSRQMDEVMNTMEDRGEIRIQKEGRTRRYWPT
jgi:hypothetical protein